MIWRLNWRRRARRRWLCPVPPADRAVSPARQQCCASRSCSPERPYPARRSCWHCPPGPKSAEGEEAAVPMASVVPPRGRQGASVANIPVVAVVAAAEPMLGRAADPQAARAAAAYAAMAAARAATLAEAHPCSPPFHQDISAMSDKPVRPEVRPRMAGLARRGMMAAAVVVAAAELSVSISPVPC